MSVKTVPYYCTILTNTSTNVAAIET